jgi:hypothetical protein
MNVFFGEKHTKSKCQSFLQKFPKLPVSSTLKMGDK